MRQVVVQYHSHLANLEYICKISIKLPTSLFPVSPSSRDRPAHFDTTSSTHQDSQALSARICHCRVGAPDISRASRIPFHKISLHKFPPIHAHTSAFRFGDANPLFLCSLCHLLAPDDSHVAEQTPIDWLVVALERWDVSKLVAPRQTACTFVRVFLCLRFPYPVSLCRLRCCRLVGQMDLQACSMLFWRRD
jgi:hypothetical protein